MWDRDTGVPAWLWGDAIDVPGSVHDAAIAERVARAFLAQHIDLLAPGARPTDFVVVANRLDGELRSVAFEQRSRGVRVIGGKLGFVFGHDRLFAISSSAWPHVDAGFGAGDAILPRVQAGLIEYKRVTIRARGDHREYVGADGRVLARESLIRTATGTLKYNAPVRYPGSTRQDFAAPYATITVNGLLATTTSTGTFTWTGIAPATVVPSVVGTYVRVQSGTPATTTFSVQPGETAVWNAADDEYVDAQLSTYIFANLAKAKARIVNPSVAAWLDTRLDFVVNAAGYCNAAFTGTEIRLYLGNATCENTGRLADVVFHEFGHAFHASSVISGMGEYELHLSEGLSDFFAANMTGDPNVGRGFYLDDSPLRDIDPLGSERAYPLDFDFDPHVSGLIISGALWDLRKALVRQLGDSAGIARAEKIFTGVMQRADDIGTTFVAALIADDDDGNLANNTPNYCAIERAFGVHGLVPDFVTTRVSPPVVEGLAVAVSVDTPVTTTCTPPAVVAMHVTWRIDDGVPSSFELAPEGTTWRGAFPEMPEGSVVSYAVDVVFDDGSVQVFPNNPADPRYQLFFGTATPIYCEGFEVDPGWEQSSNMGLEWQVGPPVIGVTGGDPAVAFRGTQVLGTDLTGDGHYRPNLIISTGTPPIEVSKYQRVHLQYWRWLTVEDAVFDEAAIYVNELRAWRNASSTNGTLDHVDREWRFHDVDLTSFVREGVVQVNWALTTDFGKELGGWTIDEMCIVGLSKNAHCGDGEEDVGEECDDGNTEHGDGCDEVCRHEPTAGGGGCCDAGGSSPTSLLLAGALLALCRRDRSRCASRSRPAGRAGRRGSSARDQRASDHRRF